jgi:FkbM family methyltransferase
MSLWDKLCSSQNKQSSSAISPPQNPITPPSQIHVRDIFTDTAFLLKDQQVQTIFDVGANRGDFTNEYVHSFPDAKIHCFEPNPATVDALKNRFKEYPQVTINNVAVSNIEGVADFCCNNESPTDSLLQPAPQWREWVDGKRDSLLLTSRIQVKTVTLDKYCQDQSIEDIDILKIDTQGAELLVLEGASGLLQKMAIRVIIAELVFVPVYNGQPYFYEVCTRLADYGYCLVNLYDCRYDDDSALQLKWADGVFINRNWKFK